MRVFLEVVEMPKPGIVTLQTTEFHQAEITEAAPNDVVLV